MFAYLVLQLPTPIMVLIIKIRNPETMLKKPKSKIRIKTGSNWRAWFYGYSFKKMLKMSFRSIRMQIRGIQESRLKIPEKI